MKDPITYSKEVARQNLPERFFSFLCFILNQIDGIFADYQKSGNVFYLRVAFSPDIIQFESFIWVNIDINRKGKEIEVMWSKFTPNQKFPLCSCGKLQMAIINYALFCRASFSPFFIG